MRALVVLLPLPLWLGCAENEEIERARSWIGVYRVDRYLQDTETCGPDGPEAEPPRALVQLDLTLYGDLTEVNLRPCVSDSDCVSVPWFQLLVEEITERRLEGMSGDYMYVGASGSGQCTLWWAAGELTRTSEDDLRAEIRTRTIRDMPVLDEEECVAVLEGMAAEALCDAYHVVEMTRVK